MNQDQTKEMLLRLEPQAPDFSVVFSGKASTKVNGLYHPTTREILLHNKNFTSDEELTYTAIHEFAHHLHFCSSAPPTSSRSHTAVFWTFFHQLLAKAEGLGLYKNVFESEAEFRELTAKIQKDCLAVNGQLMKDFGQMLLQAVQLCAKHHVRFEDYMDRVLCIPRATAKAVMTAFAQDVNSEYGYDHMKMVAAVKDPEVRRDLDLKRKEGFSPEMLKQELRGQGMPEITAAQQLVDPLEVQRVNLEAEVQRLEKKLEQMKDKLESLRQRKASPAAEYQLSLEF